MDNIRNKSEFIKNEIFKPNEETGLSGDYCNKLGILVSFFKLAGINGEGGVKDIVKKYPFNMEKYEEVCPNSVNDNNKEAREKLNKSALRLNEILENPDEINEEAFRNTINEINLLVYGDDSRRI